MDPVKHRQLFRQVGDFEEDHSETDEALLEKANKRSMLSYAVGCWCTAWARKELEEGIRLVHETPGADFVYADTDSVKYIGSVDWTGYNNRCISECKVSGAFAVDPMGITHYMGVYDSEDDPEKGYCYYEFKTLGAKKYAFTKEKGGPTAVTIAGVDKKKGGPELDKHGGLSAFEDDFVFREAGGTQLVYNDDPPVSEMQIDGHVLRITSNVAILPSTYRLGITGEYERIVKYFKSYLDNPYIV